MVVQKNLLFQKLFSQTDQLPARITFLPTTEYCDTFIYKLLYYIIII